MRTQGLIHGMAAAALVVIIWLNMLLWPIPHLGFAADPRDGTVLAVYAGTAASQAGLAMGDQIVSIYGVTWHAAVVHPNILLLMKNAVGHVPLVINRTGSVLHLALRLEPPDTAFQTEKVVNSALALLCWIVGYLLGIVRRHEVAGSTRVALFWLAMSAAFGSYVFAYYLSLPLRVVLYLIVMILLVPLAVDIHIWYPVRTVPLAMAQRARRCIIAISIVLAGIFAAIVLVQRPSILQVTDYLDDALPFCILVALIGSGLLLLHTYRHTTVAHVRRQIRLIACACLLVALVWVIVFMLPISRTNLDVGQIWNGVMGIVPLAYLIGGITPDLYRIDRIALRVCVHALTAVLLGSLLIAAQRVLDLPETPSALWMIVVFVLLYPAVRSTTRWLLPSRSPDPYRALHRSMSMFTTTLDPVILHNALVDGVRVAFDAPALGLFISDVNGSNTLALWTQERMAYLPPVIAEGTLTTVVGNRTRVFDARQLGAWVADVPLQSDEEQVVHQPGVVLWCVICHTQGHLLGILLLGKRSDFDPYRPQDVREIHQLLDAAALALTNSAAYYQQIEAEATIRQLYHHIQEVQDTTAATIARELHDEIINVNIRLNIESLKRLIAYTTDPVFQDELAVILESERTVIQTLRMICEQLYPTGIDDPFGLAAVLRMQVERAQALTQTQCRLHVIGGPQPVSALAQTAAMRIAREALTNGIKHAHAHCIYVELRYPTVPEEPIELMICDDGIGTATVAPRPGHWGLRNMYERAQMVGGTLTINRMATGGTAVVFRFAGTGDKGNIYDTMYE